MWGRLFSKQKMVTIMLIMVLMCVLTGCGKSNNAEENSVDNTNATENSSAVISATEISSKNKRQAIYIWEMNEKDVVDVIKEQSAEVPKDLIEKDNSELKTYIADITGDGSKECICVYKVDNKSKIKVYDYAKACEIKIFGENDTFTDTQKNEINKVFDEWFKHYIYQDVRPDYTREGYEKIVDRSVKYEVVNYNGEPMIKMSYYTEEMDRDRIWNEEDEIQIFMKYSEKEFLIDSVYLSYKYRYCKTVPIEVL